MQALSAQGMVLVVTGEWLLGKTTRHLDLWAEKAPAQPGRRLQLRLGRPCVKAQGEQLPDAQTSRLCARWRRRRHALVRWHAAPPGSGQLLSLMASQTGPQGTILPTQLTDITMAPRPAGPRGQPLRSQPEDQAQRSGWAAAAAAQRAAAAARLRPGLSRLLHACSMHRLARSLGCSMPAQQGRDPAGRLQEVRTRSLHAAAGARAPVSSSTASSGQLLTLPQDPGSGPESAQKGMEMTWNLVGPALQQMRSPACQAGWAPWASSSSQQR